MSIIQPFDPFRLRLTGIAFNLVPGREVATGRPWGGESEVQRAPDSGGSPGTWATLLDNLPPLPASGGIVVDPRPSTTDRWHYRWRHKGAGVDVGAWSTSWSALPDLVPKDVLLKAINAQAGVGVYPLVRSEPYPDGKYALVAATNTGVLADASVQLDPGNGIKEGGVVFKLYRHREEITVNGPDTDGDVTGITFGQTYQSPPMILFKGGQYVSYSEELGNVRQRLRLQAFDVTASGFKSRTQIVQVGATTARAVDFPASDVVDAVGETTEVDLGANVPANDDTYTVHYFCSVTLSAPGVDPLVTLTVALESNDGGGWVERATFTYARSSAGTSTFSHEQKPIVVSGFDANDDIRIRAKSFVVHDATGSFIVRGGDNGATDAFRGVTWTTAADTTKSAIPATGDHVIWIAQEVA